ncbi:hypothetical protein [Pseudomonas baetica]|jgi:hypothetical protein|uniref:hypothetical protein n=1 Tax=Pseudomonas baetica TaxID=674054 RepID=UPI0024072BC6|nr:hypothetical protein [Pseudomonas baetica]MDF9778769.1 hypothetical protein [Pseudomonas baetica]
MKQLIAGVALLSVAGGAVASEDFILKTDFYKGTELLHSVSQSVPAGYTANMRDTHVREFIEGAQVSRSVGGEVNGKPKYTKGTLILGFSADVTPSLTSNGQIRVVTDFKYSKLVEMRKLKVDDGVELDSPETETISSRPQALVAIGKPETVFTSNSKDGEYRLVVTATAMD